MSITLRQVSGLPAAMRVRHLASLEEPQELYLERRVAQGSPCLLEEDGAPAGYAVIDDGGTLLELFHEDFLAPAAVFSVLTASASVTSCLYQSFDLGMARLAATVQGRIEPVGILFRNIWDPDHRTRSDIDETGDPGRPAGDCRHQRWFLRRY
jgi:hypothetical protein